MKLLPCWLIVAVHVLMSCKSCNVNDNKCENGSAV